MSYVERCRCGYTETVWPAAPPAYDAVRVPCPRCGTTGLFLAGDSDELAPLGKYRDALKHEVNEFQNAYIRAALKQSGWNVSKAARESGLDRVYLHRLMRKHGIRRGET